VAGDAGEASLVRTGRCWNFGDDISTDLIMPATVLWGHVTTPAERKAAIMPNRPGWAAAEVQPGDLILAGRNFGCGSSRAAPRVLARELGLSCVVAESFSRLFQRNAVNIGFPVLICPGISSFAEEGDTVEVHFDDGRVRNLTSGAELVGEPYPPDSPPGQLLRLGGLRPFLERWLEEHPEVRARGGAAAADEVAGP
jgi:3-isopropylmalate/(R)-2-methylmalate dehydratase small subunit